MSKSTVYPLWDSDYKIKNNNKNNYNKKND